MPDVTPNSPAEYTPIDSQETHVRLHRAIETALESIPIGLGSTTPGTTSTAAPIKGFYRTAAAVNVGIPSMSTTSAISTVVSVAAQMGNAVQPGDPVVAMPQGALPAGVLPGAVFCTDTNSITFTYFQISGITATTTVSYHIYTVDLT